HAIGDACLDAVLDAFEAALKEHPRKDHRHGIVHCQITRPDQLRRIRDLGLHVYAQSVFLDYDNHIVEARVGRERAQSSYNWKTLTDMGVSVSNGSDCPVELPDVMKGIQCAVTRTSLDGTGPYLPSQAFSVEEALDSFTARGAEASFEENVKGKIAPGFMADFTVLDRDPFTTDPADLHTIKTESCYLGGRRVYAAE
ncbi:MAG: amidohydrolase family protein, partial [Clostridia bacterium]|nr:amidohydrolase family protein [Clostridia bacterium]